MTKKEFKELTGEDPEDVMGNDWKNDIVDFTEGQTNEDILRQTPCWDFVSNCCSARVNNGICSKCKEPCATEKIKH